MIMKKLFIIICILIFICTGCSKEEPKKTEEQTFSAGDFLSAEEVSAQVGYTPVAEEENTRSQKTITYKNAVAGQGDIVRIEVYPQNQKHTKEEIKAQFEKQKSKNEEYKTLIQADDLGIEAFIAIPSVHMYKNGYYIVVTAGSGGGDEQIALLKNFAQIVVGHMNELLTQEENQTE